MKYDEFTLEQLGHISRGRSRHRPRNDQKLYGGIYPFIQTGDVKEAGLYLTKHSQTYNEFGLSQSKLWDKGTLLITIAANIAESTMLSYPACFPDSIVGFIANPALTSETFIKYYIDFLKLEMQSASRGTTQDNLSVDKLLRFKFQIPAKNIQLKIESILGSLDYAILINKRKIEALEEVSSKIYREWFINFKFTGHDKVKMTNTNHPEFETIPETFTVSNLGNLASLINRGISPTYNDNSTVKVINQRCIRNHAIDLDLMRGNSKSFSAEKILKQWDSLVNSTGTGTLGRVATVSFEPSNLTCDSHVSILRPGKNIDPIWFSMVVMSCESYFERSGEGATGQTELSRERISQAQVVVPPIELQEKFGSHVKPMLELKWNLTCKIKLLSNIRDLLLPKLISGEIDASEVLKIDPKEVYIKFDALRSERTHL